MRGTPHDAGGLDATATGLDAGATPGGGGSSCGVGARGRHGGLALAALLALHVTARRRRERS